VPLVPSVIIALALMVWLVLPVVGSVIGGVCWVIGGRPQRPA
jgi:hypothetical protein